MDKYYEKIIIPIIQHNMSSSVNKEAIIDSLEFLKSYKEAKKQIENREFDDWNDL